MPETSTGSGRAAWARVALVLGLVLVLDQVAKRLATNAIAPGESDGIFPGIELVHVRNRGVAFGFLGGGGAVVLLLTFAALAALVVFFALDPRRPLAWLPTGLLLGGAFGNLVDRVRDGAVTDFIHVPLWPAFNLADVAITVGVLALLYVLEGRRRARA